MYLHACSDASERGYGSVVHLLVAENSGQVYCSFVMRKSCVAPLKTTTIPRLELQATLLSVRLADRVAEKLDQFQGDIYYWTDSIIVL